MTEDQSWYAMGKSVRGAAHLRAGLPNQDYIDYWWPKAGEGLPLIVAVSDGHGSVRNFRSNVGSRLAVETALEVIRDFLPVQPGPRDLSTIKRTAEERLPQVLVREWQKAVRNDIKRHETLSPEELNRLAQTPEIIQTWQSINSTNIEQIGHDKPVDDGRILAYGATLLAVVVAQPFIIYLQLGDGDILIVSEQGHVTRPLPGDERLFANETTSLCSPNAWRDFRVVFHALGDVPPALILLATDGYANSFRDDREFLKVGSDLLEIINESGLECVEDDLEGWLDEASQAGSGDDITVGIVTRVKQAVPSRQPAAPAVKEKEPAEFYIKPELPSVPQETAGAWPAVEPVRPESLPKRGSLLDQFSGLTGKSIAVLSILLLLNLIVCSLILILLPQLPWSFIPSDQTATPTILPTDEKPGIEAEFTPTTEPSITPATIEVTEEVIAPLDTPTLTITTTISVPMQTPEGQAPSSGTDSPPPIPSVESIPAPTQTLTTTQQPPAGINAPIIPTTTLTATIEFTAPTTSSERQAEPPPPPPPESTP